MSTAAFARARSDEQRAARRSAILAAGAAMLVEGTRVADLSLNELSRRVGLAKSNVLRYFETREAVLLELLDLEHGSWLDELEVALASEDAPVGIEQVADAISRTVASHPVLAELMASSASVLEHNVSPEVAAASKRRAVAQAERLVGIVERWIGVLPGPSRIALAGAVTLVIGSAWSMCRPSPGMVAAYERYPELAELRLDYRRAVRELVATVLTGLLARPAGPLG